MAFFGAGQNKTVFGTTPAASASTGTFGGFGATPATTASGGGFSFGGFGAPASTSGGGIFGAVTTTTASTGFGGFGAAPSTASAGTLGTGFGTTGGLGTAPFGAGAGLGTSAFGAGGGLGTTFGKPAATATPFGAGFGTPSAATGFGTGTSTLGTTGFGTGTTGLGTAGFGMGTTGLGTTGFGTGTTGLGATGFGAGTTGLGATGFGAGLGAGSLGQPQQQQGPEPGAELASLAAAVTLPVIFGDERDALLAKWNQLQAFWGAGKGFYNQQGQAVALTPDNPFCRFKAVGYSCLPKSRNRDGLVALIFNKKVDEIEKIQSQVVLTLHRILGNNPSLTVCVEGLKPLPDDKAELVIYIQERAQTGAVRRLPATEVFAFMGQGNVKPQLAAELSVQDAIPKTGLSGEALKAYMDTPPAGIDPLIWRQAKLDNPDPGTLIPVPMVGFGELRTRLKHEATQTELHAARLGVLAGDVASLQRAHCDMQAKIEQYKRKHLELGHRVLQVLVRQEVHRKAGYSIQADEERLRGLLEAAQAHLNAPTQFKGRLNELMSQIRLQSQTGGGRYDQAYSMEDGVQEEILMHLKAQQAGLQIMINIIKDDCQDLDLIETGLSHAPGALAAH